MYVVAFLLLLIIVNLMKKIKSFFIFTNAKYHEYDLLET